MYKRLLGGWWLLVLIAVLPLQRAWAADVPGPLVSVAWLQARLGSADLVVLDASSASVYRAGHIAGALNVDGYSFGLAEFTPADFEKRLQALGLSDQSRIVVYDPGGTFLATRLHYDLYRAGIAAERLHVLDGGLAKWRADGAPVTQAATPAPPPGSLKVAALRDGVRVHLPEFLSASGDPAGHALVEALEPGYHFGEIKFFNRAGHVPHALMWPSEDFFNPDKTFKSRPELRRMADYLGIRPEQQVHTHCGGGIAASVPFFALRFLLDYPRVTLYQGSQREWLSDERQLPFWTYDAPAIRRDMQWLDGFAGAMLRMFSRVPISVIDVRPAPAYAQGHVTHSLNVEAAVFRSLLGEPPEKLAAVLQRAGVNVAHEAVIVSERGGIDAGAALAFVMLEKLGQRKVSLLADSIDEWGLRGLPLTKQPTTVGTRTSPQDLVVPAGAYAAQPRPGVLVAAAERTQGLFPKVYLTAGATPSRERPDGRAVHVPASSLLAADGTPRPAKELWALLSKAGVPRYAEIVCVADDPGAAAVAYVVLKLMGYPDVKVMLH